MQYRQQHITYCTNIHSGESWDEHFTALKEHFPEVRESFAAGQDMGIGLRVSNRASLDLMDEKKLDEFKMWLHQNHAYVFTMNGFPYGNFHQHIVKANVHSPDWTTDERVDYTLRLCSILAQLLPEGIDGGISTAPLSYRYWHKTEEETATVFAKATHNVLRVAEELIAIKVTTGKRLHLDIEPEPDGLLETGTEFINWYEQELIPAGIKYFREKAGFIQQETEALLKEHICLCYDVCHFAIGYEDHAAILEQLKAKELKTGKIQVSAALQVPLTNNAAQRAAAEKALLQYAEAVYLHQVIARRVDGSLVRFRDLPDALPCLHDPTVTEWRIHFHVPVFTQQLGVIESTQKDICTVLDLQKISPFTNHLEVETYTWEVLPTEMKLPIGKSISRELNWLKEYMSKND